MLIDEISITSVHTLLSLSAIMPDIKRNSLPLGGVQRIFVGDLFPLAPVANLINGDIGEPIYKHVNISAYIPQKANLVEVAYNY